MKSFIATTLLASAAVVDAQISALPACGIICGLGAANATNCTPVTNFNCTCQYANQAIILPILQSCLAQSCTDTAQSSAAISAGKGICMTVSQTASSVASYSISAKATAYSTGSVAPTIASISSASLTGSASSPITSSATYTGAALIPSAGVEALVAAAGLALLAL